MNWNDQRLTSYNAICPPGLNVDEEKDIIDISKMFLEESRDFFIITIDSALAALAFLNKENFDTIIPDVPMPGMEASGPSSKH